MRRRRFKHYRQDRIGLTIAARYNLAEEYKTARRHRRNPIQALEEWDLLTGEAIKMFGK